MIVVATAFDYKHSERSVSHICQIIILLLLKKEHV